MMPRASRTATRSEPACERMRITSANQRSASARTTRETEPTRTRTRSPAVGAGDLVVLHEGGAGKRVALDDVPAKGRGGGGVALAAPDKPAKEPAGPVAAIRCVDGPAAAVLLSGQLVKVPAGDTSNRAAISRPLVDVVVGDEVVGIA